MSGKKPRRPRGAHALAALVPAATEAVFARYGFAAVALITDWEAIVGRSLAEGSQPERLRWPRQPSGKGRQPAQLTGATLVVRVAPHRVLDIQYGANRIIERVNAYFGYRAVGELRLLQAPPEARAAPALPPAPRPGDRPTLPEVADAELRDALERLGAGMRARRRLVAHGAA